MTDSKRFAPPAGLRRLAGAWCLIAMALPVMAQTTDTVVVTGSLAEQRAFDAPYSVDVVDAAALRSAGPMINLSEALARVPGLVVNLRNNYAQDLQISSRGFGARASFGVRGIRLYSDGIPAAGADGQGQVSHFDLAGADRIEVLRGPFSALYGSSSGGVIALVTRAPAKREFNVDVDQGSAGLKQLRLGLAAPFDGGFSVRAEASGFQSQGFRPHSEARRTFGNVRLGWEGNGADRVVVVLNGIDQPAQDPLGLTRAQFDADPRQTAPQALQYDTRKKLWQDQAGLQWQHRFQGAGPLLRSEVATYYGQRSVTQWQSIPTFVQAAPTSPGGVIAFDRYYGGIDARLFWRWEGLRLVTGAAEDDMRDNRQGYNNFTGSGTTQVLGVTGELRKDEDDRAGRSDVYAQGEVDLGQTVTAIAGVRHGRLTISSRDKLSGGPAASLAYAYTLPVLALRWQPTAAWSLYASAGRGYETPTLTELAYRPDGGAGLNTGLRPERSQQWELGSKWHTADQALSFEGALFRAETSDEIGVLASSGGRSTYQNVGHTLRQGAEASVAWRIAPAWRADLALTLLRAVYRDNFAGKRIAGTMPRNAFAELVWSPGAAEFGVELRGQGPQAVNDANSDFAGGYGLLALRAQWHVDLGPGRLELLGRVDNLADRSVAGSVIVNESNQRFFEPAAGRNALVSVRWRQGF
jgi:iron complex outermembrane receptor protein